MLLSDSHKSGTYKTRENHVHKKDKDFLNTKLDFVFAFTYVYSGELICQQLFQGILICH